MTKEIINILQKKKSNQRAVWLMRQAGRYLPEYRALRAEAGSFLDLCMNPAFATEITLQPIRRFSMDGAIIFADILLIPMALGLSLDFVEGEGPVLQKIDNEKDCAKLKLDIKKLSPVFETVAQVKNKLDNKTTLIGFCGAPWTVACYMLDGNSKNDFAQTKFLIRENPNLIDKITDILVEASTEYLLHQISAGADVVQIFDSWAGLLSQDKESFYRWIIKPTQKIVDAIHRKHPNFPIIGFPRGAEGFYQDYAIHARCTAMGLDQNVNLDAAQKLQKHIILQGNLDPEILNKGGDDMIAHLKDIMDKMGSGHIVNLGHGVLQTTPAENVERMVKFVQGYKS